MQYIRLPHIRPKCSKPCSISEYRTSCANVLYHAVYPATEKLAKWSIPCRIIRLPHFQTKFSIPYRLSDYRIFSPNAPYNAVLSGYRINGRNVLYPAVYPATEYLAKCTIPCRIIRLPHFQTKFSIPCRIIRLPNFQPKWSIQCRISGYRINGPNVLYHVIYPATKYPVHRTNPQRPVIEYQVETIGAKCNNFVPFL